MQRRRAISGRYTSSFAKSYMLPRLIPISPSLAKDVVRNPVYTCEKVYHRRKLKKNRLKLPRGGTEESGGEFAL